MKIYKYNADLLINYIYYFERGYADSLLCDVYYYYFRTKLIVNNPLTVLGDVDH